MTFRAKSRHSLSHSITSSARNRSGDFRTILGVPLFREGIPIGVLLLQRAAVQPFTDKQIKLVETFADQAVIAIENVRLFEAEQQRSRELSESLEQQTATSDVLRVISSSPSDIQPVLETIGERAGKLCNADVSAVSIVDGELIRLASIHGMTVAGVEASRRAFPVRRTDETVHARAIRTRSVCHVADVVSDPQYQLKDTARVSGYRGCLGVPMVRDEQAVGAIVVARREPGLFSDAQVQLLKTFADQAVIAIENVRLFKETKTSLEQQTATADVLKVISRSTFDLQTVLDTLVESAARLCAADKGTIFKRDRDAYWLAANYGNSPEAERYAAEHPILPNRGSITGRVELEGRPIHIADVLADTEYNASARGFQRVFGYRTGLGVPLLREGATIGVFVLTRDEVNPFTEKQIELVTTFADQAVIAIENVRLFEAEQHRTRELSESLEQQTATSEVLRVISSSPGDLQPVFATMLENAVRICDAKFGNIQRWDGELLHHVAAHNTPPAFAEARRRSLLRPNPETPIGRMVATKAVIHVVDLAAELGYIERRTPTIGSAVELGGVRTILYIPMFKENELIGAFTLSRQEVRPFTDKQIELVQNFAAQAVIAIENARLLTELRARTDELGRSVGELRALGEVSQAVNSTLDLETVLDSIVGNAVQLSRTEAGAIYVFDDRQHEFRLRARYGMDRELIDALAHADMGINEPNIALILAERDVIQVADLRDEARNEINEITLRAGFRARLIAPLMRGEDVVGLLVVRRRAPGTFPQNTIDLIKTFAAQSAVAIENARLFHNVETSLEDLRTAQDRLVQTEKLASLGQLTAGIAHEIKNPLNFVNNFSAVSIELIDELREALGGAHLDNKRRAEIGEIADTLQGNLDKVVQHGKRADAIVKNMLLHSRQGSGEHRPVDVNALVDESLNLAYHGARAEKQGFNITLERSFDPAAGEVDLSPQEITRALLNLISNGFYAATKRKAEANGGDCEPTLAAATKNLGDRVEISIRDNGTGIPPEVREKMFNPFFTTKPAGEGTGLGLSISHDIIVKQHSGLIEVDSQPGEYTEVRIILPRVAAFVARGRA
jgi:GAF domain-containing protein